MNALPETTRDSGVIRLRQAADELSAETMEDEEARTLHRAGDTGLP
jgi:hypothetical protein